MCGIMGYVGPQKAAPILLDGLRRLEYRGYDSTGIAVFQDSDIHIHRSQGKLLALQERIKDEVLSGNVGIGHTRWATHGKPSDENAHPHQSENFVVVHNGSSKIILRSSSLFKRGIRIYVSNRYGSDSTLN